MHLDRPSIHKEGPWSIAIFHQGPHPIASISRPWEKLPWWIPSQCWYAKRRGHRVPGTFPTGETRPGWTFGLAVFCLEVKATKFPQRFTCWSCWCYQKWKVGLPQGTCFTTQGWHWLEYQNGSFDGWEMVKWTIGNLGFFWRSFSFNSAATRHQSHLLNQLLRSTLLAGLVGGVFAFWGFWRYIWRYMKTKEVFFYF